MQNVSYRGNLHSLLVFGRVSGDWREVGVFNSFYLAGARRGRSIKLDQVIGTRSVFSRFQGILTYCEMKCLRGEWT
jgi:hypothetical protein